MQTLYFAAVISSFLFSLPILSGHTLDVYHTQAQKSRQKSPSGHHRTNLSGYIFATKARIDNQKKNY